MSLDEKWIEGKGRTIDQLRELGRIDVGTVIEIRLGKRKQQLLIGDVNLWMGTCDDCSLVNAADTTVIRYRQVWKSPSKVRDHTYP